MDLSDYSYTAATQASFYKAEAQLLKLDSRLTHDSYTKYLKKALLAMDAIFAVRISRDIDLPLVPLIAAFDLGDSKNSQDIGGNLKAICREFRFPEEAADSAERAIKYMQTMDWVSRMTTPDTYISIDTVLQLHEYLVNGISGDDRYQGFRRSFLPHQKGINPRDIPSTVNELCDFANKEIFSPLGQASAIHHIVARIVPFETMVDHTGLVLAFTSMFKRGLFSNGFVIPICWGASIDREVRRRYLDDSRCGNNAKAYRSSRESWAVYNARNTQFSVIITHSFLDMAQRLRGHWRTSGLTIPHNSALDKLLELLLGIPTLSTKRASELIGKSYGATNEAIRQLVKAGMVREVALDNRERIFVCDQSVDMITDFTNHLFHIAELAETKSHQKQEALNVHSTMYNHATL